MNIKFKYYLVKSIVPNGENLCYESELIDQKDVEYTETMTLKECIENFGIKDVSFPNVVPFKETSFLSYYYNDSFENKAIIHHVIVDGKVKWHVNINDCYLSDVINTYDLKEIILYKFQNIGGLGAATGIQRTWNTISIILTILSGYI